MEIGVSMDNDSGYVSHNPESNLDSSSENVLDSKIPKSFTAHDMYISEDALHEKPSITKNDCKEYDSFESVVNCSQDSVQTEFSGFNESDRSDVSFVVPEVGPIVWDSSGRLQSTEIDDRSRETFNCLYESNGSFPEAPLKSSLIPYNFNTTHKVLTNVTNTFHENPNSNVIKNVYIQANKENICRSETPKKYYVNRMSSEVSPDLFTEEEEFSRAMIPIRHNPSSKKNSISDHCDRDVKLLKKVQSCLTGVYPPPNLTMIEMTVTEMLDKIQQNKNFFWTYQRDEKEICEQNFEKFDFKWPDILRFRYHGLHYNRNKISEDFEHLCSRYAERYVGAETQSSCTVFETYPSSSCKRKLSKPKWGAKSPGRRLSHLARRRITFSSANLQSTSSTAILGSRARQILVDAKKLSSLNKRSPRKSPRKTPSKSPFKIRKATPSSSAKKKLAMRFRQMSGEFENLPSCSSSGTSDRSVINLKRALFPSPKKNSIKQGSMVEKKSTKRALFSSPLKRSPQSKSPFKLGKRKRCDADEENRSKFARSFSVDIKPSHTESRLTLNRTLSDRSVRSKVEELSDQHKKKLQWAVYESLRLQNITSTHPQYKVFASALARVTRKFLPGIHIEGRTTEKMFRIARYHSHAVVKGKTVDEIVNEYTRNKIKNQKPQGYVGIHEFQNLMDKETSCVNKSNISHIKVDIVESVEKNRAHVGTRSKFLSDNKIDRIKKVISFEDTFNKKL